MRYGDSLVEPSSNNNQVDADRTESDRLNSISNNTSILPLRFLPEQWDSDENSIVGRLKTPLIQILGDTFLGPQEGQYCFMFVILFEIILLHVFYHLFYFMRA